MPGTTRQPALDVQPRDLEVLRGLFESRVMTLRHVAALYFDGRSEMAKKRLQKLKAAGLVRERKRRPYEPAVLCYTKMAHRLLQEYGRLMDLPPLGDSSLEKRANVSPLTIAHELAVMDVKVAFVSAARAVKDIEVAEFSTWPRLFQFHACAPSPRGGYPERVLVKPDGFLRLHETGEDGTFESTFFLEVDKGTETLDTLARKAAAYRDFYTSGGMARRQGAKPEEYAEYPFRVLFVFRTDERRNNAAERFLQMLPPVLGQAWLTTFDGVTADPLGPVWITPRDYQTAVAGTAFNPERGREAGSYNRRPEREAVVDKRASRKSLFA